MSSDGTKTTARRTAAGLATSALAVMLSAGVVAAPVEAAAAPAGATWSKLMHRKFALEIEAVNLTARLPGLRADVVARSADIRQARTVQTAAATTVTAAAATDEKARAAYASAKTALATAKKNVTTVKKQRPVNRTRLARVQKSLAVVEATVRTRATAVRQTAATVRNAQATYASATVQVTTATNAHVSATGVVTAAEQKIKAMPQSRNALAAQASELSGQVVTQSRASFTVAHTTQVYGITVNRIVAYPFQRMIDDAATAGITLSGGGFRTKQRQIELRKINGCPDIWTAPSSSCRVPTAIPGRSLHELGLAVDISTGGRTITSRNSPAFKWLAANAGRYGMVNLPSEPWHWSITGG